MTNNYRFLSLQFQDDAPGGAQIISADGLRMIHLESLGWGYVYDPKYKGIHHDGGHLGFYAYVRAFPALKIGIVYPINPVGIDEFGIEDDPEPWFSFQDDDGDRIKSLIFIGFTFKRNQ